MKLLSYGGGTIDEKQLKAHSNLIDESSQAESNFQSLPTKHHGKHVSDLERVLLADEMIKEEDDFDGRLLFQGNSNEKISLIDQRNSALISD